MKRLFAVPILLFIVFTAVIYLIAPQYSQVKRLQAQAAAKQENFENAQNYFSKLQALDEKLEGYSQTMEKIEASLPQDVDLPALLNFIQNQARTNGLILQNINPVVSHSGSSASQKDQKEPKIKETFLNFTVAGSIKSFESFLAALEAASRLIEVETLSFGQTQEKLPSFNLMIKVFSY